MEKINLDIAGGTYYTSSMPFSAQRAINLVPVYAENNALNKSRLQGASGISLVATAGNSPGRGEIEMSNVPYYVLGQYLYKMSASGELTQLGSVIGTGFVSMADNGEKLAIVVPGGPLYVYNATMDTFRQVTNPGYIPSSTVSFKDGYYIFTTADGKFLFNSKVNDPTDFDPLQRSTAEIDPDLIIGSLINHNELIVFGEITIEIFQTITNPTSIAFPFQRIQGALIQKGCRSSFGYCQFDNTFVFIGGGLDEAPAIWLAVDSSTARKISTDAIDFAIQQYTADEISRSFAFPWAENGKFFVAFTFTSARIPSKTLVYDGTASKLAGRDIWHERQSGVTDNRWRVNGIVRAYGKNFCTDYINGNIGLLDQNVYTEYGSVIYREITSSPFCDKNFRILMGDMEVTMESGTGLTIGQGSEPIIRFSYSDDGARTWSSQFSRTFGKIGRYFQRVIWRRNGLIPTNRVLRFTITDPVKVNIIKVEAYLDRGVQ